MSPIHNMGTSIYDQVDNNINNNSGAADDVMYEQNEAMPEEEIVLLFFIIYNLFNIGKRNSKVRT